MEIVVALGRKWTEALQRRRELLQRFGLRTVGGNHLLFLFDLFISRLQHMFALVRIPEFLVFLPSQVPVVQRHFPCRNMRLNGYLIH